MKVIDPIMVNLSYSHFIRILTLEDPNSMTIV